MSPSHNVQRVGSIHPDLAPEKTEIKIKVEDSPVVTGRRQTPLGMVCPIPWQVWEVGKMGHPRDRLHSPRWMLRQLSPGRLQAAWVDQGHLRLCWVQQCQRAGRQMVRQEQEWAPGGSGLPDWVDMSFCCLWMPQELGARLCLSPQPAARCWRHPGAGTKQLMQLSGHTLLVPSCDVVT